MLARAERRRRQAHKLVEKWKAKVQSVVVSSTCCRTRANEFAIEFPRVERIGNCTQTVARSLRKASEMVSGRNREASRIHSPPARIHFLDIPVDDLFACPVTLFRISLDVFAPVL